MAIRIGQNSKTFIGSFLALYLAFSSAVFGAEPQAVRAEDYQNFWLWAGVRPQPVLKQADELYVLAGEISRHKPPRIFAQRSATPRIKGPKVWIVYRVQSITWNDAVLNEVLRQVEAWKANGNNLVGLQIDFDAGSKNLETYAEFLTGLRAALPREYALSVTGLLDWSVNGDAAGLDALAGVVDEVVLQIYQGRKVIPGYAFYLEKLKNMKVKFRIGLLQGGEWQEPLELKANPFFNGHVVFLLNDID
jgi:Protein of unknown function (DUF3142)